MFLELNNCVFNDMDDYDPADLYEADEIAEFEQRYAEELNELDEIEEEIDFNVAAKITSRKKTSHLDGNVFNDDFKNDELPNSGKRSVSQMDDISISFEEHKENTFPAGLKPKKLKLDDEPDLLYDDWDEIDAMKAKLKNEKSSIEKNKTDKILDQLKSKSSTAILNDDDLDKDASDYNRFRQRVFTRPVFGSDVLNVTSTDGDRVFLKLCSEENVPCVEEKRWMSNSSSNGLNLLSVPFDRLKNEVQQKVHTQRMNRTDELIQQIDNNLPNQINKNNGACKTGELWVEKYTPRRYTELLSDDGTNRFVLKWLKLWDQVVFGIEPEKKKPSEINNEINKVSNFPKKDGKPNFEKKKYYDPEDDLVKDSKGRPKKKIVLLCGNPGLGKTTLAHVIAKHAGYQVVEMNASDDRSPEVFMNKIETSTQMKSVIGVTKKPNCLIIDEIDGAPIQAINILLDLVKTTDAAISGKGAKTKKKRKKKEFILNRPIICICNDMFVPALRQLRQVAFTLRFPTTLSSRLANRLLSIAQNESLRIDMSALLFLTDKTENDIRSCLNTLQFIQQKKKYVKQDDLKNLDVGQKDMKKGAYTILSQVFQMPKSDKKKFVNHFPGARATDSQSSLTNRFHYILHLVSGNSEFEKVTQGLFDQYLHSKTKDPYLESINLGTEWLVFYDILQKRVSSNQDYTLWRYLPFLPVAFHLYFARINCGKIQMSNVGYENHIKSTHNKQTLELLISGINPHLRRNCSADILSRDIVPYLYFVTSPNLRPVNTKLYSESEKQLFSSLVSTLISYNLTFRQERNQDGQYAYVLEPNIEELVTYPGMPQHRQLLYATKQLIGREVELEKMRKAENLMKKGEEINPKDATTNKSATNIVQKQKIEPKKISRFEDRPQLDFFGRVIKPDNKSETIVSTSSTKPTKGLKSSSVLNISTRFQFNEGYTNAVRRTIKISEFL